MKKILKKISLSFISFWGIMCTKVRAAVVNTMNFSRTETSYGGRDAITPNIISIIWNFVQLIILPIVLLIGICVYWKKSKNTKIKKVIKIIIFLTITVIICFLLNMYIDSLNC